MQARRLNKLSSESFVHRENFNTISEKGYDLNERHSTISESIKEDSEYPSS
jgi:DNA-binding HxlR family transcriptional regulator